MFLVVVLSRRIAAALLCEDVHHDGAFSRELNSVLERMLERLDVVAVDRPDVTNAERFEE